MFSLQAMSTTAVETWVGADLSQVGPIYPGLGTEMILFIIGLVFWLGFHVLQFRIEKKELAADEAAAHDAARLSRVFKEESTGH